MSLTLLLISLILFQQTINDNPTQITNNCGMVLWNQPQKKEDCTEISLVDGYCCYVKTKSYGTACIRQSEIDEDNKNEITDEMKNSVNRLKDKTKTGEAAVEIVSVECEGFHIAFYGLSLLLLGVMLY